ncbi:hydroxyphenylacetyl-CoA thioesterase PaaI [Mangrovitalea sediminis]|uniref:hydroxyphenylacetyl-CoA thioesterase PaaI n=1 Tax=Mangrovitalea sediminis TaxID=1982043 RepID=UPI001D0D7535|nr:hydroxyphenylacetyl-CoA thioesterase PaaI [Mangrovitalea sediminis]
MSDVSELSPQELAERCAAALFERDRATRHLGMQILRMAPGVSVLRMTVTEEMLQGHDTCHGGYMFTLADSAFAFACNSQNAATVASGCSIDYIAPAKLGDVLTATAEERSRNGRTGVYDVRVENQLGDLVALFRGKSYQVRGPVIREEI